MTLVPSTVRRVPEHTAAHVNRQIARETAASVAYFAEHPDGIGARLEELGVARPAVEVETVEALERSASGKLQMVVAGRT